MSKLLALFSVIVVLPSMFLVTLIIGLAGGEVSSACSPAQPGTNPLGDSLYSALYPAELSDDDRTIEAINRLIADRNGSFKNNMFPNGKSPFTGLGADFVASARRSGVNPFLAVAIASHESQLGTYPGGVHTLPGTHNAFGRRATSAQPNVNGWYRWSSWQASVNSGEDDWFEYFNRRFIQQGSVLTIEDTIPIYSPAEDGNSEGSYITSVRSLIDEMSQLYGGASGSSAADANNFVPGSPQAASVDCADGGELASSGSSEIIRDQMEADGIINGKVPESFLVNIDGCLVTSYGGAASNWERLVGFAESQGVIIKGNWCYRDYQTQIDTRNDNCSGNPEPGDDWDSEPCSPATAEPCKNLGDTECGSRHGLAIAIDVGNRFGAGLSFTDDEFAWMQENAEKFGWYHPDWAHQGQDTAEAWHWEYKGITDPSDTQTPTATNASFSFESLNDAPTAANDNGHPVMVQAAPAATTMASVIADHLCDPVAPSTTFSLPPLGDVRFALSGANIVHGAAERRNTI